jgi:hypothetical protein
MNAADDFFSLRFGLTDECVGGASPACLDLGVALPYRCCHASIAQLEIVFEFVGVENPDHRDSVLLEDEILLVHVCAASIIPACGPSEPARANGARRRSWIPIGARVGQWDGAGPAWLRQADPQPSCHCSAPDQADSGSLVIVHLAKIGTRVKRGELLIEFDYQAQIKSAHDEIEVKKAENAVLSVELEV